MTALETIQRRAREQEESYSVMVDGNRHQLASRIRTTKELITVAKCRQIIEKVELAFNIVVGRIEINMNEWDYSAVRTEQQAEDVMQGEWSPPQTQDKQATYFAKTNTLQIWEKGLPVYENRNGVITRDQNALCDSLC